MFQDQILTVLGPIPPDKLGVTLMHEHILLDISKLSREPEEATRKALYYAQVQLGNLGEIRWEANACRDNLQLLDVDVAIDELMKYKLAGGQSIVDTTPYGCGRDVRALQAISRATGLNIIIGCGYYIDSTLPPGFSNMAKEDIAIQIISDFIEGVAVEQQISTTKEIQNPVRLQVRPGIIGEIGTSSPITQNEEKSLRGAAIAQKKTGAAITVHLHPWHEEGLKVLDILESEGASPNRIILGHLNPTLYNIDYHKEIARRGAYVEYDLFGYEFCIFRGKFAPRDWESVRAIKTLIDSGYIDKLLLSHDICVKAHLTRYGGFGYAHILNHVVELFLQQGVSEKEIEVMMIENPKRVLTLTG